MYNHIHFLAAHVSIWVAQTGNIVLIQHTEVIYGLHLGMKTCVVLMEQNNTQMCSLSSWSKFNAHMTLTDGTIN